MAFGQKNYPQAQGIPPTRYTIAQIGCFITSFCNLLVRYGKNVDPPTINAYFRDRGLYVDVDDGVRDDVSWDFVTKYDSSVVVTGVGGASRPPHNNCIVKFVYDGGKTHFCLVNDINNGTIIDSWDGVVKSWNVYGGVKAWASYQNNTPQAPKEDPVSKPSAQHVIDAFNKHIQRNPKPDELAHYQNEDVAMLYAFLMDTNLARIQRMPGRPTREAIIVAYQKYLGQNPREEQITAQMGQESMGNVYESIGGEVEQQRKQLEAAAQKGFKKVGDLYVQE